MRTPGITPTTLQLGRSLRFNNDNDDPSNCPPPSSALLLPLSETDERSGPLSPSKPNGRLTVYSASSIDLNPTHEPSGRPSGHPPAAGPLDPFSDGASVISGDGLSFLSQATNVIPIAYVPTLATPPDSPYRTPQGPTPKSATIGMAKPPLDDDRLSMMSGAGSFTSFNSTMFALDTPQIATAQRLNLSQLPKRSPPSSFPPPARNPNHQAGPNKPPARPINNTKSLVGKSPLSQAPVRTIFPVSHSPMSSPSQEARDPFSDTALALSPLLNKGNPTHTPARPYPVLSPSQLHPDLDDLRFSMDSLAGTSYALTERPDSVVSSQSSVLIQSATVVQVGHEHQAPQGLYRSGSLVGRQTRAKGKESVSSDDQPASFIQTLSAPPMINYEKTAQPGQRDTQYSLGAFDFIPPEGRSAVRQGEGRRPGSLDTLRIVNDLEGA